MLRLKSVLPQSARRRIFMFVGTWQGVYRVTRYLSGYSRKPCPAGRNRSSVVGRLRMYYLLFLQTFRFEFLPMLDDGLYVGLRPFSKLYNERDKRISDVRQFALHLGRHYGIDFAGNKCVSFQCLTCLTKHMMKHRVSICITR